MNDVIALYPTARKVEDWLKRNGRGRSLLDYPIMTFPQLVDRLWHEFGPRGAILDELQERLAAEEAMGAEREALGSADHVLGLIRQFKSAALTADDLRAAARALDRGDGAHGAGIRARVTGLANAFERYQRLLAERGLHDRHDRERVVLEQLLALERSNRRPALLDGVRHLQVAEIYDFSLLQFMIVTALIRIVGDATLTIQAAEHPAGAGRFAELTWNRFVAEESIADKVLPTFVRRGGRFGRLGFVLEHLFIETADTAPPADDSQWPRLWWCPSGLLSFLPLHAAGDHSTQGHPAPRTVLDRVVSSYTPTVRALVHARRLSLQRADTHMPPGSPRLLVVAMPRTPDASDLPGAANEATMLRQLLPKHATVLIGSQAVHDSVQAALPRHSWAHFACHAASDLANPSASHLLLDDHQRRPLTVIDLARLRLDDADLAFLSACATARTGIQLADEQIHLAAGFQLAGYRHVIATLWPIDDIPAFAIAEDVYTTMAAAGSAEVAAQALHRAIQRARLENVRRPSTWAAHIHSGA